MKFKKFGKFIKELRKSKNLTQEELAKKLYVSRQAISNWEQGKRLPEEDNIYELCKFFEISVEDIMSLINADIPSGLPILYTQLNNHNKKKKEEDKNRIGDDTSNIVVNNTNNYLLLNFYNDRIKYANRFKKGIIICILVIVSLLLLFAGYIIYSLYNAVDIYTISGKSNSFAIYDGLFVTTRDKIYFYLGNVINETDQTIKELKIYYYDKNNDERIVLKESCDEGITPKAFLYDYMGYDEYFDTSNINKIIKSLYIDFTFEDGTTEIVNLEINKQGYRKVFDKYDIPISKEYSKPDNTFYDNLEDNELVKLIKAKFKKQGDGYQYNFKDKTKKIECVYLDGSLIISVIDSSITEMFTYDILSNYLFYAKYANDDLILEEDIDINNIEENQKDYYSNFEEIMEKLTKK